MYKKIFPKAKLNSEINACFLLKKHGDPHFLMHEFKLHKVTYNIYISISREVLNSALNYFDFNVVKNTSSGSAGSVRTHRILKFVV